MYMPWPSCPWVYYQISWLLDIMNIQQAIIGFSSILWALSLLICLWFIWLERTNWTEEREIKYVITWSQCLQMVFKCTLKYTFSYLRTDGGEIESFTWIFTLKTMWKQKKYTHICIYMDTNYWWTSFHLTYCLSF